MRRAKILLWLAHWEPWFELEITDKASGERRRIGFPWLPARFRRWCSATAYRLMLDHFASGVAALTEAIGRALTPAIQQMGAAVEKFMTEWGSSSYSEELADPERAP